MVDRVEVNRALAKAIAYKHCGKDAKADVWAARLIHLLECADILHGNYAEPAIIANSLKLMGDH